MTDPGYVIGKKLAEVEGKGKAPDRTKENLMGMKGHLDTPKECPIFRAFRTFMKKTF